MSEDLSLFSFSTGGLSIEQSPLLFFLSCFPPLLLSFPSPSLLSPLPPLLLSLPSSSPSPLPSLPLCLQSPWPSLKLPSLPLPSPHPFVFLCYLQALHLCSPSLTHTHRLCVTMPMIKLQSSDGEIFDVDVEIAKASNTIKTMIEGKTV